MHDERRFVFCVVPKAACTSVKTVLSPLFGLDPPPDASANWVHRAFDASGYQIRKEKLVTGLDAGCYDGYFSFGFVRNPWSRLYSCWRSKVEENRVLLMEPPNNPSTFRPGMGFAEFARAVCEIPDTAADPHFRSQHVVLARKRTVLPSFIGKVEHMEEDFPRVAARIGLAGSLPRVNESGGADHRDVYDRKTARMVARRYRVDAKLFGYSFRA